MIDGGRSPNGAYEFAITGIEENIRGALVLRETKSKHVIASTESQSPVVFKGLEEPFGVDPGHPRWNENSRFVAFSMHTERHRSGLFAFRVIGRSVQPVAISGAGLIPFGWINRSDLICQAGGEDAVILRLRDQPPRASVIATTQKANAYWQKEVVENGRRPKTIRGPGDTLEQTYPESRSPNGRYEISSRWEESGPGPQEVVLRETKTGKNLFSKESLPRAYLGMDSIPGPRWSPDGRFVVFTMVVDYNKLVMLGFSVDDHSVRKVKIGDAEGLTALGWVNHRDLICQKRGEDAVLLRFRDKPLTAVEIASTCKSNAARAKQSDEAEATQ
jgi:hypothetical protein